MFGPKVKLTAKALDKAKVAAGIMGCSLHELIEKIVTTESDKIIASTTKRTASDKEIEEIANQMKGLGYLE